MKKLFHGKNSYLAQQECRKEYDILLQQNPTFETQIIDADTEEIDKVAEVYKNIGMFSTGKIAIIKRLQENKRYPEIIEDLKSTQLDNVYLLFLEDEKVASNTKYFKLFSGQNEIYEANELNKRSFVTWLKDIAKNYNISFELDALQEFAQNCNYDTQRAENELTKFKLAGIQNVSAAAIKEFSPDTHENDIWELIEAINATDENVKAITTLENLFEHNTDAYYIMAMLNRNLRQIVMVKYLVNQNLESKEICSILRIPPFTLPQIKSCASKYTNEMLVTLYEKITNMDFETKIGNLEPKVGLTLMITLFEKYLTR
jgi:DNA polymerase III delta subunit